MIRPRLLFKLDRHWRLAAILTAAVLIGVALIGVLKFLEPVIVAVALGAAP